MNIIVAGAGRFAVATAVALPLRTPLAVNRGTEQASARNAWCLRPRRAADIVHNGALPLKKRVSAASSKHRGRSAQAVGFIVNCPVMYRVNRRFFGWS